MTTSYQLYFSPGSCSRVSIAALELLGVDYELCPVLLANDEQHQPAYQALNAKGKVPLLVTPEGLLTETLAIAFYLHQATPGAGLLPGSGAYDTAIAMSWLAWCSSTLHPLIYRARMASRIHPDLATHDVLRLRAVEDLSTQLGVAESTFSDGREWLCGASWSLVDAYLLWCFQRARQCGCAIEGWPRLMAWEARAEAHPAWGRMLQREAQAMSEHAQGGSV